MILRHCWKTLFPWVEGGKKPSGCSFLVGEMALTLLSEGFVAEAAGGPAEEVEGKVAAAATTLETPGCSGAGARYEQGSRSGSSCGGNEEMEDEEEVMEEGTTGGGAAALFGGFGTEEGEMDCDEEDEVTRACHSFLGSGVKGTRGGVAR